MTEKDYPTKLGRIGSILALIASTIFVQWPLDFNEINLAAIIVFIATLIIWISVEAVEFSRERPFRINELDADARKLNNLMAIFHQNAYYHFSKTELQTYINATDIEPLHHLKRYQEDDLLPFHNREIEERYQRIAAQAGNYIVGLWTLYTSTGDGRATWRPAGNHGQVTDQRYESVISEKRRLDHIAWAMADDWKDFVAYAKRELRGTTIELSMP